MNDQRYTTALFIAAITYLVLVPLIVFLVVYVVLPLIVGGPSAPFVNQVGEFVVYFFAAVWGVVIVFPVIAILRSRRTNRGVWGAATAAVTIEALACLLDLGVALSVFAVGLVVAGTVFGYVASLIVRPSTGIGTPASAESHKA